MKLLEDKEFQEARAKLEQELQSAGEEAPVYDEQHYQNKIIEFYNYMDYIIDYYMDLPKETKNLVILWTLGTYTHESFNTYPYLFLNAMRSSGKTRLLKIINAFAYKSQLTMSLTESVLFRTQGTLLLDEFEGINRKGQENLRELLNSAYKKGTKIFRMKKKKGLEGENQVVEEFQPYRPVAMANIAGMEEVLGDRCINLQIEKSSDKTKTRLMEDFSEFESIKSIKKDLEKLFSVGSCMYVGSENIQSNWNIYVKSKLPTPTYIHTYPTLSYTNLHLNEIKVKETEQLLKGKDVIIKDHTELFDKIYNTNIDGRHLELFFPLFLLADNVSKETLDFTIASASRIVNAKKLDENIESKDVSVYELVSKQEPNTWYSLSSLADLLRLTMGGTATEWVTNEWLGRAIRRLRLDVKKSRHSKGIQVILDVAKAKDKLSMFGGSDG